MAWSVRGGLLAAALMMRPGVAAAAPTPVAPAEAEADDAASVPVPEPAAIASEETGEPTTPEPADAAAPASEASEMESAETPASVEPAPTDVAAPPSPAVVAPGVTPPAPDHVRIHPPRYRGTGLFAGAAAMFGAVALYQLGDAIFCGGCAVGVIERLGLAAGIAGATSGGVVRALHDSWYDTAYRRERPPIKRFVVAGAVLVGVGGALGLANETLWWGCWIGGRGPYAFARVDEFGPWVDCRRGAAYGLLDGASALVATGGGLLGYGLTMRKRQAMFRRARVVATVPSLGVGRSGLSLQLGGRF